MIDFSKIKSIAKKNAPYHLKSMLFATFEHFTSLRKVPASMLRLITKTKPFQLKHIPYRSTLSDTNRRRSHLVFANAYYLLLHQYLFISNEAIEDILYDENKPCFEFPTNIFGMKAGHVAFIYKKCW